MWMLLNESGTQAVQFTSMLAFSVTDAGDVVSDPIEKGSFTNYNKVDSPLDISVTLAIQGDGSVQDEALSTLRGLKNGTDLVSLQTPEAFYESLNIESLSYARSGETGPLVVEIQLVEIRQVETNVTTTDYTPEKVKNPTSASTTDTGKAQGRRPISTRRQQQLDEQAARRAEEAAS